MTSIHSRIPRHPRSLAREWLDSSRPGDGKMKGSTCPRKARFSRDYTDYTGLSNMACAKPINFLIVSSCAKEINWLHMLSKQSRTEVEKTDFQTFHTQNILTYLNHHPYNNNNPKNLINL